MSSAVQRTYTNHSMGEEILVVTLQIDQHILAALRRQTRLERVSECVVAANWERKSIGVAELYGY